MQEHVKAWLLAAGGERQKSSHPYIVHVDDDLLMIFWAQISKDYLRENPQNLAKPSIYKLLRRKI